MIPREMRCYYVGLEPSTVWEPSEESADLKCEKIVKSLCNDKALCILYKHFNLNSVWEQYEESSDIKYEQKLKTLYLYDVFHTFSTF